jgi:hypothetical protein
VQQCAGALLRLQWYQLSTGQCNFWKYFQNRHFATCCNGINLAPGNVTQVWKTIVTTFDQDATIKEDDVVTKNVTVVTFTVALVST